MRDKIVWRLAQFVLRFASEDYKTNLKAALVLGQEALPLYLDFYERYEKTLQIDPFYGLVDLRAENPHFFARAEKTHRALTIKEDTND